MTLIKISTADHHYVVMAVIMMGAAKEDLAVGVNELPQYARCLFHTNHRCQCVTNAAYAVADAEVACHWLERMFAI